MPPAYVPAPPQHSVVIDPTEIALREAPAKRKRTALTVVGAVVAVAAVGLGVFFATRGDDAPERYSLTAAASNAEDVTNVAYEMEVGTSGGSMRTVGRMDTAQHLMAMEMSGDLLGVEMTAIFDMDTKMMYVDSSLFIDQGLDVPTQWVSVDMSDNPSMQQSFGNLDQNPLAVASAFEKAKSVVEIGMDKVQGDDVKHYKVTVDSQVALDANPSLQDQLDALDTELPDTITYDVYIDAENNMRRLSYDLELAGEAMTFDMLFTAVGDIEPIELPDPSDITSQEDIG
jgi:hypothetical protein